MKCIRHLAYALLIILSLSGCEGDVPFGENNRTVDFELENAESISLGVLQSTVLAHRYLPIFNYLDASSANLNGASLGVIPCALGGEIVVEFSREPGTVHRAGDLVSVFYEQCQDLDGIIYNGSISGAYHSVEGLNKAFVGNTTEECVGLVQDAESINTLALEYTGAGVFYVHEGEYLRITVDGELTSDLVSKSEPVIIVLFSEAGDAESDRVFVMRGEDIEEQYCQGFKRQLNITANNLRYAHGETQTTLNGGLTLIEQTNDLSVFERIIDDSHFEVQVRQNNALAVYAMKNFTFSTVLGLLDQTYSMSTDGEVSSDAIGGTVEVTMSGKNTYAGSLAKPYPSIGGISILGRGSEGVVVWANGNEVLITLDANADTTADEDIKPDTNLYTTWQRLLDRDFIYAQ